MIIPCNLVLKRCLPCNDDPIRNITAEAPDVDVFIGFRDFRWNPPLGTTYFQLACKGICFSEVSQEEANLCALQAAQDCTFGNPPPPGPPSPPTPPNGNDGQNNTPNNNPPIPRFTNTVQTCDALCPDGSIFTQTVAAGTITELSQALADEKAHSLACRLAQNNLFCISAIAPPACIGDSYFGFFLANSGTDLIWSIDGDLPPGLTFDPVAATLNGTPTVGGSYMFIVEVTDSLGRSQSKVVTICIMEIVTAAALPQGALGQAYAEPLVQQPATVSSEVWTLVSGSLPTGITLAANGALSGVPADLGDFAFTLKVDATCNGSPVSCQKAFTMRVVSGFDCGTDPQSVMDAVWANGEPGFGPVIFATGGDGVFTLTQVGANTPVLLQETNVCNPGDEYTVSIDLEWTVGSAAPDAGLFTVPQIRINGVFTNGPITTGPGTFTLHADGAMPQGLNNLWLFIGAGNGGAPITLNGTITVRPLTPPP